MPRKSRSARRSRETPGQGVPQASPPGGRSRAISTLPRELADFLVEFSIVLHKRSMYPPGHPHLADSADRFVRRMTLLLETHETVSLGVARHRLVFDNVTTDANNALLRDLAHRLHRHRIASVHLTRGATLGEIEDLLNALSSDPQRGDGPVGKRLDRLGSWSHIRLRPVGYDRFELRGSGENDSDTASDEMAPRDSWVELAQLALATESTGDRLDADPLVVAQAIGRKSGEVAYDRVVLGYLARVADEMSRRRGGAQDQLALRISKLIGALNPETLRRLLEASADGAERRQFVLNASQILAADAVMEVVEAAANVSHQTISHSLLRLLHKLAHHAEEGLPAIRAEADGALRRNVARLIGDWELEDPNPSEYNVILEGMARRASTEYSLVNLQIGCDPEVLIKMALELDCVGPPVYAALDTLLACRELVRVANYLDTGPQTRATQQIWDYVATPQRLELELAAVTPRPRGAEDPGRADWNRCGRVSPRSSCQRLRPIDSRRHHETAAGDGPCRRNSGRRPPAQCALVPPTQHSGASGAAGSLARWVFARRVCGRCRPEDTAGGDQDDARLSRAPERRNHPGVARC